MAYRGNPPRGPSPCEKAPLTPDDFDRLERLATSFRPSWELDEAPFSGAGALSAADVRALQGGGTSADVRATALTAAQASHAPAKPVTGFEEPANKVIVDPGLLAPPSVRPPQRPAVLTSPGPWAAASPTAAPVPTGPASPVGPSRRPPVPAAAAAAVAQLASSPPVPRAPLPTNPSYPRAVHQSRRGLLS